MGKRKEGTEEGKERREKTKEKRDVRGRQENGRKWGN